MLRASLAAWFEEEVKRGTMARTVFCMAMDMMMTWPGSALACATSGRLSTSERL